MRIFQSDHSVRMAKIVRVRAHVKRCPSVVGRSCTQVLSTYVRVYVIVVLARSPYAPVLHVELAFIILGEAVYYLRGTVRKWIRWTSSGEAFQRVQQHPRVPQNTSVSTISVKWPVYCISHVFIMMLIIKVGSYDPYLWY
jgi:hypothetical protein